MNALGTFSRPADPQLAAEWEHVMRCGQAFVDAVERYCPHGKNRSEAFDRACKAVMVANGAFHIKEARKMRVYLAGAINGCTDSEANDWRQYVKDRLPGMECLDPMRRDYRGKEDESVAAIIEGDIQDIDVSDVVLVAAERPSWGTAMETRYAFSEAKKHVVVVCSGRVSPWLRGHSAVVVGTLDEAIEHIKGIPAGK